MLKSLCLVIFISVVTQPIRSISLIKDKHNDLLNADDEPHNHENIDEDTHREGKFLLQPFVNMASCEARKGNFLYSGKCEDPIKCMFTGYSGGPCAVGIGVCCIMTRTCGQELKTTHGYFLNSDFPSVNTGPGSCSLTVRKASYDICQVKITMKEFILPQPSNTGDCSSYMTVTKTSPNVRIPRICGINGGQHMYVNFAHKTHDFTINFELITGDSHKWNLEIQQIACNSADYVRSDVLQFFRIGETASSFNAGIRHLSSQNYKIGIHKAAAANCLRYTINSLEVQNDVTSLCTICKDYIRIPRTRSSTCPITTPLADFQEEFCYIPPAPITTNVYSRSFEMDVFMSASDPASSITPVETGFSVTFQPAMPSAC